MTILPDDIRFIRSLEDQVNARMFGLEGIVRCLLSALTTGGHVLLEGNPGLHQTPPRHARAPAAVCHEVSVLGPQLRALVTAEDPV